LKILLTNDDGVHAQGIRILANELMKRGHEIIIVAPDQERSAASHAITLRRPLTVKKLETNVYAVDGTPADCMIAATQLVVGMEIDLVISGINAGQNMGEDILYSGTVAAAIEAMFLGYKALAVSLASFRDQQYVTAAFYIAEFIKTGLVELLDKDEIFNINVPNVSIEEIQGIRTTKIGHRRYFNFVHVEERTDDMITYRVGGDIPVWDNERGTDAEAINENYISITPISFHFTKGDSFPKISEWLDEKAEQLLQGTK